MKLQSKQFNEMIAKFQEGGQVEPGTAPAPAEEPVQEPTGGGEDPMQQLAMACQQVLETQDCNLAMQVCQAILQMIGGGAPAPEEAPGEPVYKMGGKLAYFRK